MTPKEIAEGLSEAQRDMLLRVCATNGGGLSGYRENRNTYMALYRRDLVQGKSGQEWCIVHTRLGLSVRNYLMENPQ